MTSAHSATPPRDIRAPIQLAMAMLLVACSAISSLTGQFGPPATGTAYTNAVQVFYLAPGTASTSFVDDTWHGSIDHEP